MTTHFTEDHRNSPLDKQGTKDPVSQRLLKLLQVHKRRTGLDATRILFSEQGYCEARKETDNNFSGQDMDGCVTEYMGIPFTVQAGQLAPIRVQSIESSRGPVTLRMGFDSASGHVTVEGKPVGEAISIMQVIGSTLSAAQICDIIRAWLDSDDATHWGEFEKALDRVVVEHGRFE